MTWEEKFFTIALEIASWSKHPTDKVGCYIVDSDHNEISGGYNGLPRSEDDSLILDQSRPHSCTVHAEANAVAKAGRTRGGLKGGIAFVTRPVCCQCAALLIQAGIVELHYLDVRVSSKWIQNCDEAIAMLMRCGVTVEAHPRCFVR